MILIEQVDPLRSDVQRLIKELDDYQLSIYPEESNHLDPVAELANDSVYFIGAFSAAGLIGIGAIKYVAESEQYGEIKRVFVVQSMRGKGVSKDIMNRLEDDGKRRGVKVLRLETGVYQPEAIGLYEKLGYSHRGSFGDYPMDDPMSVFMEKLI